MRFRLREHHLRPRRQLFGAGDHGIVVGVEVHDRAVDVHTDDVRLVLLRSQGKRRAGQRQVVRATDGVDVVAVYVAADGALEGAPHNLRVKVHKEPQQPRRNFMA